MSRKLVTLAAISVFIMLSGFVLGNHPKSSGKAHQSKTVSSKNHPDLRIMAHGKTSPEIMRWFILRNNNDVDTNVVKRLVRYYIIESNREGVNYEVAFCQMCLETGFLRFAGSVSRYQHNYCGLGCVDIWSQGDWFSSMEEGVRAHVQHLKAYASREPVKGPLADPRFCNVRRGSVVKVTELTGKWATDPDYGQKISALIHRLYND
jgi:hypothetical protein